MDILKRALEVESEMIDIRRKIHANPELRLMEYETTALIEAELQKYGIVTNRYGLKTGVVGILTGDKPGKTIAVRADIDALQLQEETNLDFASKNDGICHGCGHDIHTATVLTCARLMSEMKSEINGTVKFIFQPAEEGSGGAKLMVKNGALDNPKVDVIIAAHTWPEIPGGTIGVRKGPFMAGADRFKIKVIGKGGHAAHPHKSVDPVVISAYILTQLQTIVSRETSPLDSIVITVGKISAGSAANIIPSEAIMEGTVRTVNKETRKKARESIERMAKLTAESMNAKAEIEYLVGGPPVVCDGNIVDLICAAAVEILGEEKLVHLETPSMGSEDFAEYLEKVPGALFRIGTTNELPESKLPLHNSKTIFDEKAIIAGAATMCGTIFKFLNEGH